MIGASGTARAAEDYVPGFIAAFGVTLGGLGMAAPYLLARDERPPGSGSLGLAFGGTGDADRLGFDMDFDMGGYPLSGSRYGWVGRSRVAIFGEPFNGAGEMAFRYEGLGLLALAGDVRGPIVIDGLLGFVVWPRFVSYGVSDMDAFAAIGPAGGVRVRAISPSPRLDAELELIYTPLFGAPPSERLHHVDVASSLGWHPWAGAPIAPGFELRIRRRIAWGGEQAGAVVDTAVIGGVRLLLDGG